jgi:hypothetical protein
MDRTVDLLARQMSDTYQGLRVRLRDLSDDEFFWEPTPDCWTVYREPSGRWTYHYEIPDPVPSPLTTIGWRVVHLALCKVIYHDWAFGPARLRFDEIENPHDVATSIAMLEVGHRSLTQDIEAMIDDDLSLPVRTNWGDRWPAWRIFWEMTAHDAQHGAEIGALRDLYRVSGSGSRMSDR